jgi:UDP:flavonoid glycosyltransferase YjiC (YdhE family)
VKILFVVPPWTGHVNPTVSVARALETMGHEVAWAGHASHARALLPEGARLFDLGDIGLSEADQAQMHEVRFLESLRFLWQSLLVPLARATRPRVEEAVRAWKPDVVAVDHQAIGGALAVRRLGVKWATLCTTSASVVDTLSGLPQVKAWVDEQVRALEREAELPPAGDLSPALAIVFSTRALIGELELPAQARLVGPSINARDDRTPFPWQRFDPARRAVFVSIGTVSLERNRKFFEIVEEAVKDAPWQTVVVAPDGWITDGADQVVRAGAGVRLHFGRLRAASLRDAIGKVLDDPQYASAAARVRESFASAGGPAEAARLLVSL